GADLRTPSIEVDTFAYDVGVAALAGVGLSVLFSNWMLGGLLVLAAPVLALYVRDRVEAQTRNRAKDLAPKAMAAAAATVGPKLDEMIDLFVERLDAWAVTAGEEVHREVLEVLASARRERERGEAARALALSLCQKHDAELTKAHDGLAVLRAQLRSQPVEGSAETPTESRA
ncbi:MAG: hypothetical protein MUF54_11825, partial [Polyangiaceae bacterium]|nr:hypothetical protein [Polyangiaceae bacterium]